jgi:hypothetical protein
LLDSGEPLRRFVDAGGVLSLGIIPTDLSASYRADELVDAVETSLRATFKEERTYREIASRSLLTPACGLAMRQVADAERVFEELRMAQRRFRELVGA